MQTASLLKAAFDPQHGLRTGRLISDIFLFEFPGRSDENKLLIITDGGFNLAPDVKEKAQIIENAVQVAHAAVSASEWASKSDLEKWKAGGQKTSVL